MTTISQLASLSVDLDSLIIVSWGMIASLKSAERKLQWTLPVCANLYPLSPGYSFTLYKCVIQVSDDGSLFTLAKKSK